MCRSGQMMRQRFAEKVVVVTGGASGIGRAIAQAFAVEGSYVAVVDSNQPAAELAAAEITQYTGTRTLAIHTDVTDEQSVEASV